MRRKVEHTLNILEPLPVGAITIHVSGVKFVDGVQEYLKFLEEEGEPFIVLIKREPENPKDKRAIAILVKPAGTLRPRLVGYLSRFMAKTMAKSLDNGLLDLAAHEVRIVGGGERGYNYGLKIILFDRNGNDLVPFRDIAQILEDVEKRGKERPKREAVERIRRERGFVHG